MNASRGTDTPTTMSTNDLHLAEPSPTSTVIATQPTRVASMEVATTATSTTDSPQEWKHGLFSCLEDVGLALVSCFLPCTVHARNQSRYQHLLLTDGVPHPELGETCNRECFSYGLCCLGLYMESRTRSRIRERYSIPGSRVKDTCTALCCGPCALVQESRQLREEEMAYVRNGPVGPRYSKWREGDDSNPST